jgi:acetyltransferase
MSLRNLEALFRPRSIALIGAGKDSPGMGAVLGRNLFGGAFQGPILPVHPTEQSVHGVLTYASIEALPMTPDLALIASPAAEVPTILVQLGRRGTRAAIVYATDCDAAGPLEGAALRRQMREAAAPYGLRLVGPACLGVVVPSAGLNGTYAATTPARGDLAFVTESGSILDAVLSWAKGRDVGCSLAASLGDSLDVDVGDVLDYLAYDQDTRAVLLYVERIAAPRKFLSAARALARLKPVIVYRPAAVGEAPVTDVAGQPLIETDQVFDAAFKRAGMLPVGRTNDLIAAAQTLATRSRAQGERIAVIANGRGLGTAIADTVRAEGGTIATLAPETVEKLDQVLPHGWGGRNPVNVFPDAGAERYRAGLAALLADGGNDVVLAMIGPTAVGDRMGAAAAVAEALAAARKPGVAVWFGSGINEVRPAFAAKHVPLYDTSAAAVIAVLQVARFYRNQDMLMQAPASTPELFESDRAAAQTIITDALAAGRHTLVDGEAAAVFAAYGLPVNVTSGEGRHRQALRIAVGIDASFGPVIVFGPGDLPPGVRVERAIALPPLNLALAELVIAETTVNDILIGFGPEYERCRGEIALALVKVSQMITDVPEITGLDIDPLLVDAGGIVATGCRLRVAPVEEHPETRLAIRPYPRELEREVITRDGRRLLLRPIRPEDEPALQAFVRRLDPDDIRLRFFAPIRELDRRFAARLTQIDYDREMALIAVDPEDPEQAILGVIRITADADNASAEYAGIVRSDLKGHGLGRLMMDEIISYARRVGIGEIWGSVLAENTPMLTLARKLGFTLRHDPEDPSVIHVSLLLNQPAS